MNEFIMECQLRYYIETGTGKNKNEAKRAATRKMKQQVDQQTKEENEEMASTSKEE